MAVEIKFLGENAVAKAAHFLMQYAFRLKKSNDDNELSVIFQCKLIHQRTIVVSFDGLVMNIWL